MMKTIKTVLLLAFVACCAVTSEGKADDDKRARFTRYSYANVFISAGLKVKEKFEIVNLGIGYSAQYGRWFSPIFAVQGNLGQLFKSDRMVTSVSVDFMTNLSNIFRYKEQRRVSILPFIGAGVYVDNWDRFITNKTRFYPGADVGAQLRVSATKSLDLILEARTSVSFDLYRKHTNGITNYTPLKVGVSYKFNTSKKTRGRKKEVEIPPVQDVVSILKEPEKVPETVQTAEAELSRILSDQEVLAPKSQARSVEIIFKEYSSFIDDVNRNIIEIVARWTKEQIDCRIEVLSFANKGSKTSLAKERCDAIVDLLKKNGVSEDSISIISPQEKGYREVDSNKAMVIYVPI